MKTILIIAALVVSMGQSAFAQDEHKYDPTYSIHNYKHPNKAREAKQKIKFEKSESYMYVNPSEIESNRNYKQQNNLGKSNPVIIRRVYKEELTADKKQPINQNSVFSNRNYKRQF